MSFDIGTRVETEKNGRGKVAFFGATQFSEGDWVGIILDEAKGKNNGTVKDVEYFSCEQNYGLFVRPSQLKLEAGMRTRSSAAALKTSTSNLRKDSTSSRPSSLRPSPTTSPKMSPAASMERITKAPPPKKVSSASRLAESAINEPKMSREASTVKSTDKLAESAPAPVPVEDVAQDGPNVMNRVKKMEETPLSPGLSKPSVPGMDGSTELEYLRLQVKDLSEKLETIRMKRKEDHGKLTEFERAKVQLQSLQEVRTKLTDQNLELQRQLSEAKKETTELRDWRAANEDQLGNSAMELEMAMIDKEMAEEKCDILQKELDAAKEEAEELRTDLEIMKEEMSGGGAPEGSSAELKQVQQQNERLKEAVMKLRDLHGVANAERLEAVKETERLQQENSELLRIAEQARRAAGEAEERIKEYQEQIDASLGAEEMIAVLTDKNLDMEEKIRALEQQREELEEMKDLDEQIAEVQKQTEKDLLSELDTQHVKYHDLTQRLVQEEKHSDELMVTIRKFRNKVNELNEEIQNLKDQVLCYEDELSGHATEGHNMASMVSKLTSSATKTFAEFVERQLSAVELEYAKKHIGYLKAFLPDNFTKAGGDNDAVNINVLFPRLTAKANLFAKLTAEKYPDVPGGARREHVTKAHTAERWAHSAKVAYLCAAIVAVCGQFESAVQNISVERLARLSQLHPEMAVHEKTMDSYLELLRQDRFDEHTSLANLDKALNYFMNVFSVHVGDGFSTTQWVSAVIRQMATATKWCRVNTQRMVFFLMPDATDTEIHSFVTAVNDDLEQCDQLMIRAGKRVPNDKLYQLSPEFTDELQAAVSNLCRFCDMLHESCELATNVEHDADGVSADRLKEMMHGVAKKMNGESILLDKTFEPFQKLLSSVRGNLAQMDTIMESGSMEVPQETEKKVFPPMLERAHQRKQAAAEAEGLRWQLEKKDAEILDLKKNIKSRLDDISNYKLRLEMSEARMNSTGREETARVAMLEAEVNQLNSELKKQKIEYDEAVDRMQQALKEAELQSDELRRNQKNLSKRALLQGIQSMESRAALTTPSPSSGNSAGAGGSTSATSSMTASSAELALVEMQLAETRNSFKNATLEIIRLKGELAQAGDHGGALRLPDWVCGPETLNRQKMSEDRLLDMLAKEAEQLRAEYNSCRLSLPFTASAVDRAKHQKQQTVFYSRVNVLRSRLQRHCATNYPSEKFPPPRFVMFMNVPTTPPQSVPLKDILNEWGMGSFAKSLTCDA